MTHNYHWIKATSNADCYTISWYDNTSLICQTQTKIIGPADEVETALELAAEQLRKENASLFPEDPEQDSEENLTTMSTSEEEVYG